MSTIKIAFRSAKDFDVDIDDIKDISPRGMELAFARVQKEFAGIKGKNVFDYKAKQREDEEKVQAERAKEIRIKQLAEEELSKHRAAAMDAAKERFDSLKDEQKEALLESHEANDNSARLKNFLAAVAAKVMAGAPKPNQDLPEPSKPGQGLPGRGRTERPDQELPEKEDPEIDQDLPDEEDEEDDDDRPGRAKPKSGKK